jgi:hypothetical protein
MNDKENFAFFAEGLLPLGINLAVIEYTLAPAATAQRSDILHVEILQQILVDDGFDWVAS